MLPQNAVSSVAVPSTFLSPDNTASNRLIDIERGGIALNDPSQGLNVQDWTCFIAANGTDVQVKPDSGSPITLLSQGGIEELAFTFDQNMRPCVAYRVADIAYLRWFDSVSQTFAVTAFAATRNPKLALDDKRITQIAVNSDIIFAYMRGNIVYYRQQRDRFQIERLVRSGVPDGLALVRIGMGQNLRFQFEIA
jgi:hypothetical protein